MNSDDVKRVVIERVATYSQDKADRIVAVRSLEREDGRFSYAVVYIVGPRNPPDREDVCCMLEVTPPLAWLLWLRIGKKLRGKGHGFELYRLAESIARDFGCEELRMTPSGATGRGEDRSAYIVRKLGYARRPESQSGLEYFKRLEVP